METYENTRTRTRAAIDFVAKSHPENLILRLFPRRAELTNGKMIYYYKNINERDAVEFFKDVVSEVKKEGYEAAHVVGGLILPGSIYLPRVVDFRRVH